MMGQITIVNPTQEQLCHPPSVPKLESSVGHTVAVITYTGSLSE